MYFGVTTKDAKELLRAEQSGKPIPAGKFDFGVDAVCAGCREFIRPPKKILRCSACKAVIYCSGQVCAICFYMFRLESNFKMYSAQNATGLVHTSLYAPTTRFVHCFRYFLLFYTNSYQRHMQRLLKTQNVLKSFPWGRLETNGTFNLDIARGRFSVLGSSGYGYWSHRGGTAPHAVEGFETGASSAPYAQSLRNSLKNLDHLDGNDLLKPNHLSDEQGWKLSPEFIPYRDFSKNEGRRPLLVTKFDGGVVDWDSWYRWRKIPKISPAALLMNFPMSVYHMLVNCLKVTSPNAGCKSRRVNLNFHLLGVEVELNFVPLYVSACLSLVIIR